MSSCQLVRSKIDHTRHGTPSHFLSRRGLSIWIDLDRLDEAAAQSALFSVDGFNLLSFRQADYGPNFRSNRPLVLNPHREPDPALVHGTYSYDHPMFDERAVRGQQRLPMIQGTGDLFFAGAWTGHGFHEDGLKSAIAVARTLGVEIPWQTSVDPYPLLPADDREIA